VLFSFSALAVVIFSPDNPTLEMVMHVKIKVSADKIFLDSLYFAIYEYTH